MTGLSKASADKGVYAYHVLRVAVEVFGKQPGDLAPEQLKIARAQADKTCALEDKVLATPDAARVSVPDAALDAAVVQIKARYEDEMQFEAAMRESAMSERDLKRALWRELAFDTVMTLVGEDIAPVTDEEVEAFYADHPERFVKPELRTARHILVTINPDFPDNTPEAAHKRIRDLHEKARLNPDGFADLAEKNSECPSALDGGMLGQVSPGKLYDSLDAVLFQLSEGEVGGPVETEAGLHVILCERIESGEDITLEAAREKIRLYLSAQRRKTRQKAWIDSL